MIGSKTRRRICGASGSQLAVLAGAVVMAVSACDSKAAIIGLDFGTTGSTFYTGSFDGVSSFIPVASSTFVSATPPTYNLGDGYTLTFNTNVGAYDVGSGGSGPTDPLGLLQSFFYASAGGLGTVSYTLSGFNTTDVVDVGVIGSTQPFGDQASIGSNAAVSVPGDATISSSFTDLGSVTGATSYTGTFTGNGGEGDISALEFSVTSGSVPEPATAGLVGVSMVTLLRRRRRTPVGSGRHS
jgi:hypothetical protein